MNCKQGIRASLVANTPTSLSSQFASPHTTRCAQPRKLRRVSRADAAFQSTQSADQAAATVKDCLTLATDGQVDALLEHVPDEVLDRCIALQKSARKWTPGIQSTLSFEDVVRSSHKKEFTFDAYGQRGLIFFPLQQHQVLSSMMVSPNKFVSRCDITTGAGERAVLTFELTQQECLQSAYKGVQVVKRWVLQSITGESAVAEAPQQPDPSLSPDAVALAQLQMLRVGQLEEACVFASPASQASVGRFGFHPISAHFRPLMGHQAAHVIMTMHNFNCPGKATVVIGVMPSDCYSSQGQPSQQLVYLWTMGLQKAEPVVNCWMTERIQYTKPVNL